MAFKVLAPIKEYPEDYEELEAEILRFFLEEFFRPLLEIVGMNPGYLQNAKETDEQYLMEAIHRGQIRFHRGHFRGAFNSRTSKILRELDAQWNRKQGSFAVPHARLPEYVKQAIAVSESRFQRVSMRLEEQFSKIIPPVGEKLGISQIFDRSIFRIDSDIRKTLKKITVQPALSPDARRRIAAEYAETLHLPIQEFLVKETGDLRKRISERSFAGYRYETIVKEIERSYGVSQRKAKFLARQETSLLMTKFKQVRYEEAGSKEYIWGCVAGSTNHPVRHYHKQNEGKKFRWDTGAPINERGERKNPGQDYNCRCFAKPIVKF